MLLYCLHGYASFVASVMNIQLASFFKQNRFFLLLTLLFFFAGALVLAVQSKGETFVYINQFHTVVADFFFTYFTHVGDGVFVVIIAVVLFFYKRKYTYCILMAYAISSIVAQILKKITDLPRPKMYLNQVHNLHWVLGEDTNLYNSFPSGHTTSAFMLATILAFLAKDKRVSVVYFFLAVLVGYSRVYLGQHFFMDAYFGALIGTLSSILTYLVLNNKINNSTVQHL